MAETPIMPLPMTTTQGRSLQENGLADCRGYVGLASELVTKARATGLYSGPSLGGPLLVLAGLATVTDVMPLLGQNRILVAEALNRFDTLAPVGLRALFSKASRRGVVRHTSKDFGFLLGPRINAAGRMASGIEALRLVLADNQDEAGEAARIVNGRNDERKNIEQKMLEDAISKVVPYFSLR